MELLILLLASYGLCFGLMHKASWLTDRLKSTPFLVQRVWEELECGDEGEVVTTFFDRLLRCPYCTGFHTGWMTWLLGVVVAGFPSSDPLVCVCTLVLWSFSSSAFCYLADTTAQRLER